MDYNNKIDDLKNQIRELEIKKLNEQISYKKNSLTHNLNILNKIIGEKKSKIHLNHYQQSAQLWKMNDQNIVKRLDAIINILMIFDRRLTYLEQANKEYAKQHK